MSTVSTVEVGKRAQRRVKRRTGIDKSKQAIIAERAIKYGITSDDPEISPELQNLLLSRDIVYHNAKHYVYGHYVYAISKLRNELLTVVRLPKEHIFECETLLSLKRKRIDGQPITET